MAQKQFKGAPFGTQSARFDVSGVHPKTKQIGTFTETPYCKRFTDDLVSSLGPGKYEVDAGDLSRCAVQSGTAGQVWRKQLGANMPHILHRRRDALGPGKYNLKSFTDVLKEKPSSVRGVCDSREDRFKEYMKKCPAGPGSYGKGGIPSSLLDERRARPTGSCAIMDFNAGVERFPERPVDCGLYPGTYKMKSFTELILQHHVGKKGPYEIFTGRRDKPINSGYFAAPRTATVNPGQFFLPPMFGDGLKKQRQHGKFGQMERFPTVPSERIYHSTLAQRPEPANQPGPGSSDYMIAPLSRVENSNPPPFFSPTRRFGPMLGKPMQGNSCIVGPGRYNICQKVSKNHKKGSTAFKSQTKRYLDNIDQDIFGQEKLRPFNIPAEQRPYHRHPDEAVTCSTAAF
ncbi:lymphocyte expansion molecule-like isoform X2 [Alosa alosa]|uniref:lymphocyte expansion molecule-like isoform X2 n=1 Tax=Alosa alosa TaxID=278164 RepID=UPI002015470B|nr:lymphocyte expansion molecule-like isoform X2 [Alosa alosa]